jgi:hypothetical protein
VCAAAEDLHFGQRQAHAIASGQMAPKGNAFRRGARVKHCHRGRDDRVPAESAPILRPVEMDEMRIDRGLVACVSPRERRGDLSIDRGERAADAVTAKGLAAIAEFDDFSRAGRCAGRRYRSSGRPAREADLDLDRRAAPRVPHAAPVHRGDPRISHREDFSSTRRGHRPAW